MANCTDIGYSKNDILLFKFGGTPTTSNAFLVLDSLNPTISATTEDLNLVGDGKMNAGKKINDTNNIQADLTASLLVEGTGAAGTAPHIADFYKAAGLSEAVEASTSVTYTPHSDAITGSEAIVYKGGKQKTAYTDIVAGFSISGQIGTSIKASFTLQGFTDLEKTAETPTIGDVPYHDPFRVDLITAVTVGGTAINIESFELAMNAEVSKGYFTGLKCAYRSDFRPTLRLSAVKNFTDASAWTDFLNQSVREVIIVAKNKDGETLTITALSAEIDLPEDADSAGRLMENRTYMLKNDANGVPFTIKYS